MFVTRRLRFGPRASWHKLLLFIISRYISGPRNSLVLYGATYLPISIWSRQTSTRCARVPDYLPHKTSVCLEQSIPNGARLHSPSDKRMGMSARTTGQLRGFSGLIRAGNSPKHGPWSPWLSICGAWKRPDPKIRMGRGG